MLRLSKTERCNPLKTSCCVLTSEIYYILTILLVVVLRQVLWVVNESPAIAPHFSRIIHYLWEVGPTPLSILRYCSAYCGENLREPLQTNTRLQLSSKAGSLAPDHWATCPFLILLQWTALSLAKACEVLQTGITETTGCNIGLRKWCGN